MKLVIIALDDSWKSFYSLAEETGKWKEIEVLPEFDEEVDEEYKICREEDLKHCQDKELVIACMTPDLRQKEYEKRVEKGMNFATLIHPDTYIYHTTNIGQGTAIFRGAIIYADSKIAENVVLMEYSSISHDSQVGKHSVVMEKVTVAGHGNIGKVVLIKSNAVIKEECSIGNDTIIENGAVVLKNMDAGSIVWGNPARQKR